MVLRGLLLPYVLFLWENERQGRLSVNRLDAVERGLAPRVGRVCPQLGYPGALG